MADLDVLLPLTTLDSMKNESKKLLLIFESILSSYDPAADQESYQIWDDQVYNALADLDWSVELMTNRHGVALGPDGINEWKQITIEAWKRYDDHYHATVTHTWERLIIYPTFGIPTNEVKTAEVEIAHEKEGNEVDLIVFDEEECFDDEKNSDEEVKEFVEDIENTPSGAGDTLLDEPVVFEFSERLLVAEMLYNDEEAELCEEAFIKEEFLGMSAATENRYTDKVLHEGLSRIKDTYLHGVVKVEPIVLTAGDTLLGVGPDEDAKNVVEYLTVDVSEHVKSSLVFAKRDTVYDVLTAPTANLYLCEGWLSCVYGTRLTVKTEETYAGFATDKVRLVRIIDFYFTSPSLDLKDSMLYLCKKYGTETEI